MRKTVMAGIVTLGAWLGAALSADAQVGTQPSGPGRVESDDTSSLYQALITTNYNFKLHLKVFHNGVLKHESNTQVNQSGPSYSFSKTVSHVAWGLAVGNPLLYRGKATLTSGPFTGYWSQADWNITVSAPTGMAPVEDRDRRTWA